ncbi:hypothetical protein SIL85_19690 [Shewanella oneidensis]|uniref:Predicted lipoprotein n=1 Tax=Shewanella oneidensis (strain ATCC 700550 / JCM 31522 / CIP 106686 / LMG 19005 / NCIMB 14063 / MR-1) TaxID=211586 RepID=K4PU36_SHEON|nr:hypothetical protein [Shewanella oneidensis]AFV73579.1 predicted lipoprotein [Shewanella oneidensis MR-1]MDX5999210.1 hypothetical protein [Shewanella oneidensis]MEE2028729.1 hypothetical protein [Shewanella oneidensis]
MKKHWMLLAVLASISLTACSNIDFRFEDTSEKQAAPNQSSSDAMVQDNERSIRDARQDGKMAPKDPVKF